MELSIDQALQEGVAAYKDGRLNDAERIYRAIIQAQPNHPDANHNLGLLAVASGKPRDAIPLLKLALETNPEIEQFWLSYIDALLKAGRHDEAKQTVANLRDDGILKMKLNLLLEQIKEAVQTDDNTSKKSLSVSEKRKRMAEKKSKKKKRQGTPSAAAPSREQIDSLFSYYQSSQLAEFEELAIYLTKQFPATQIGWKALGIALRQTGRLEESIAPMQKSIQLCPEDPESHSNLGNTLQELGRLDEAEESLRQAVLLKPDFAEAHSNLGNTLKELGRLEEAEASLRQAVLLKPDFAEVHSNLGNALREQGRLKEAEASLRQAVLLKPDLAEAHSNLGITLREQGRLKAAQSSYIQAIALNPNYADAHYNLGNTLKELGRFEEAEVSYNKALALIPDSDKILNNLGYTLKELGKLEAAEVSYRQAIAGRHDALEYHSNLLMLISSMRFDNTRHHDAAADFVMAVDKTVTSRFNTWSYSRERKSLRIGFVSGDLSSHPVGYFLEGLLIELGSSSIELFAYPTNNTVDEVTSRLQPLFDIWSPLTGLSDTSAAQKIHEDGLHILFDLSGHTAGNRLAIFARKPAPIQVSWLGYFASTGLPEMDYVLGDPHVMPNEEANHFVETIWQLPESYLCFTPPDNDLKVGPLPASSNRFVTFGCFNRLARMTDEVVAVRAAILHAVPSSKLYLKDKQLDHETARNRVLNRFSAVGIAADRLILEGRSPRKEYLACYSRVDIALSPFPYGGGTTSVEGLWMGVPVIAKKGNHFLSHLGESIAHNSGLSDWIAVDNEDYIRKAVAFSSDLQSLSALRKGMREQILNAPLFDGPRFARHFEEALRAMRNKLA